MNDRAIAAVELAELIVDVAAEVGAAQNFEVDDLFAKVRLIDNAAAGRHENCVSHSYSALFAE